MVVKNNSSDIKQVTRGITRVNTTGYPVKLISKINVKQLTNKFRYEYNDRQLTG